MNTREILKTYWGFDHFRDMQEDIVSAVMDGVDTLALLPTGGGKSICYQVPAMAKQGICIVVSPLIALMKDQVRILSEKGIKAIALTGGVRQDEISDLLDNAKYGGYKFLYLSPERLQSEWIAERIKGLQVNLIAVDEAHCISQWGHDFRPAYRNISKLREWFPKVPVIALTATATEKVARDILSELKMEQPAVFRKSFARPNIAFDLLQTQNKQGNALDLLRHFEGSAIIYVRNRKSTLDLSAILKANGIPATFYHGGLNFSDKEKNMKSWMENQSRVIVATNAFGMGIDKPDVRLVLHLQLPENLENYYQEAGRAGRDGKPSRAVLITEPSDGEVARRQFLAVMPDKAFLLSVYLKLCNYLQIAYGEGFDESYAFNLNQFCQRYELPVSKTFNALQFLDRQAVLSFSQEFSMKVTLRFLISSKEVIRYISLNVRDESVVAGLIRQYPGIYEVPADINLQLLSKKTGKTAEEIAAILEKLASRDIVEYRSQSQDATVIFHEAREDERTVNRVSGLLKEENSRRKGQLESVIEYASGNDRCKSRELLTYFGEKSGDCGICSYCREKKKGKSDVSGSIIRLLSEQEMDSRSIVNSLQTESEAVIFALRELLERKKIRLTPSNRYTLYST